MKFKMDPFYLYPIEESKIDTLFIDREQECQLAETIIQPDIEDKRAICPVIGGIGTGKSSMLIYIRFKSKELNKKTIFLKDISEFEEKYKENLDNFTVLIVDDIDKVSDERAYEYYNELEKIVKEEGGIIFFSDTYQRDQKTSNMRDFTTSKLITLPKSLNKEKLSMFLEKRMKKCFTGDDFDFPFSDRAIELAAIRSTGNLRNFLKYCDNAWTIFKGKDKKIVEEAEMIEGIINVDRVKIGSLDLTDLKILWNSTVGKPNKGFLAHESDIHFDTLDKRLNSELSDLTEQVREGKEVSVISIYRDIPKGEDILEGILKDLKRYDEVTS